MAKSIIKEIIIVLLLCLAIMLILGILLYEYVPITKTLPNEVSYTTPDNVKQELLSSSDVDDTQVIMTYEVNQEDLNNYRRVQDYVPGKANPFSSYESTDTNNDNNDNNSSSNNNNNSSSNNSNGGSSSSSSSTSNNNNDSSSSGGHFFQNTGTK